MVGHCTKWRRKIHENCNHLSGAHERYRRQTDGRAMTYSEQFTFAKNEFVWVNIAPPLPLQVQHVSGCLLQQGVFLCQTAQEWGMITSINSFCYASVRICYTSDSCWLIDWVKFTSQTSIFTWQDYIKKLAFNNV